ncbi:MAG: glycosyltransferase family 4 protein [Sedimentisphaerales bacterium]|nr:glycosyltransferase family 4 protein [Sedimentisphaerales bacterium]
MRIAILTWESLHSTAVGGVAVHASELSAALAEKGHEVHLFTRRMPNQRSHDLIDGVHYHRCTYFSHPDFVEDVNNMCRAMVDHFFLVEDLVGHFDIVHAHDWLCANAMIWIKKGRGHKCVFTIHSTEYGRCGNAFFNGRSVRVREQERAGTYWADKIIAVSQATKEEIMWMYEVPEWKTNVINNGVNWKRFDININPGDEKRRYNIAPLDPTVLFCGRLTWQKGADILVEAIGNIIRKYPAAKFIFAGDGDQRGSLEARARHLNIAHATRFVGYKMGDELTKLFKLCDVVCVPSRNEPFGIVVLEAWSASKPVVVTEIGGPKYYVEHETNGLKICPRVDSISWGIDRIFSDFDRARWMGCNGRKGVESYFSWDRICSQNIEVYQQLCPPPCPEPVLQQVQIETEKVRVPRQRIISLPNKRKRNGSSMKLEARLLLPDGNISEDTKMTVESLITHFAAHGFRAMQKDHYLKIRGDWEHLTTALAEARNEIIPMQNGEACTKEHA